MNEKEKAKDIIKLAEITKYEELRDTVDSEVKKLPPRDKPADDVVTP